MNPRLIRPTLIATLLFLTLGFVFVSPRGPASHAQGGQVQVTAADPTSAAQGTVNLNVKVTGKGFKNGAKAKWFVTGTTDPGGVTVNSTSFVSSTEVTANITVADIAVIGNFDIQVLNSDGRGGKGTELFAVTAKGNSNTSAVVALRVTVEPADSTATPCRICSDGLGEYVDGVDGVSANFTKYGWLSVVFQDTAALRTVNFDYSFPGNPSPPPVLPVTAPKITTYKAFDPFTRLQDMSYGMTQCIPFGWAYNDGGNIGRNQGFQFGPNVSGSSYAIITCTAAANPDNSGQCIQWSVEPRVDGTCNASASLAGVTDTVTGRGNKLTYYDRGLYKMPFKLTLLRK